MTATAPAVPVPSTLSARMVPLRAMALRGLARMYRPGSGEFVFRVRRTASGVLSEGRSLRYAAISLLGLATEDERVARTVLGGRSAASLCAAVVEEALRSDNLGDVALSLWASRALAHSGAEPLLRRLVELRPVEGTHFTVELAWTLSALSADPDLPADLRAAVAGRLRGAFVERSGLFPHVVGRSRRGPRAHVSCFADLVYPVHALSRYALLTGDRPALAAAARCGERMEQLQGRDGQWWWHYDVRTGDVIEPYPVYAVHQDAMAPLALFALEEASGRDFTSAVERGLAWLESAPELRGGSLIDREADLIWRKVARREPGKLARSMQAAASRVHPALRVPGLDVVLPPGAVDYEDRPYHLGWLLHVWPERPSRPPNDGRST